MRRTRREHVTARRYALAGGGTVWLDDAWLPRREADALYAELTTAIPWQQGIIRMMGREIPEPRLSAWIGDPGASYTYSGRPLVPLPWPAPLARLRGPVSDAAGEAFDSVLCNLYRNGQDSMGFHADDEPELGTNPVIASLSLGATRQFRLRPRRGGAGGLDIDLPHGSLLVMGGTLQHCFRHGVPKQPRVREPRINLTFRRISGH